MDNLIANKVGFNDIEMFNLGLEFNLKCKTLEDEGKERDISVIEAAMRKKRKDEVKYRRSLIRRRNKLREEMMKEMGRKSNKYRRIMKHLMNVTKMAKDRLKLKYENKIEHLKGKYMDDKEKRMDMVPEEMRDFRDLAVFNKEKFDGMKVVVQEIVKYGEVDLNEDEEAVMRMHPKMAVMTRLEPGYMDLNQEIEYTKVRWQLMKEEEERDEVIETPATKKQRTAEEESRMRKEQEEKEIVDAMDRQVYNPVTKEYDERRWRVTDMPECSRIHLPKPLEVKHEAEIEMRRDAHSRVSREYREMYCDQRGTQESNLTPQERRGLKSLEKRKNEGEIVITMTDKSTKLCIMKREEYLKLGEAHVGKDKEITREEMVMKEKVLNSHALSWCRMFSTGENHGHEDRVRASKVTRSGNRAELYLSYKDHKAEPGKTRPIATGCSSNTLALSNSVSSLVEALANAEEEKREVISTEDLIYNTKEHNVEVRRMRKRYKEMRIRKLRCGAHHPTERAHRSDEEVTYRAPTEEVLQPTERDDDGEEDIRDEEELDIEIKRLEEGTDKTGVKERILKECEECGPPIEEEMERMCLLGLDVVALFPSMSAKKTGEIVRRRIMKSKMRFTGFDWRRGAAYIVINKHLTSSIGSLWKILPYRRKVGGTQPGMTSRGMMGKEEELEKQWAFKNKEVTEEQKREIVARVVEIAIRIVFENFCYDFGGKIYLQLAGGPIGARLTMACARVVMTEWGEEYLRILNKAGVRTTLLKIYVDDVRQSSTLIRKGLRYDARSKEWEWTKAAEEEDEKKEQEGESKDARMARILQPAMNGINSDLVFTTELSEDFDDDRLPTLDFKMWLEEDMEINHTFYEKPMKTQMMIPWRSAMAEKQKISIASNDLNRRLSNINVERMPETEKLEVVDKFTHQLKNSGYGRQECREIVMSGVKSWLRRHQRREQEGKGFYRGAASTLQSRMRKKLLDKTTWFRPREEEQDEEDRGQAVMMRRGKKRKNEGTETSAGSTDVKSVLFCPYTVRGELAKRLRKEEETLEGLTGYRVKVVEQVGDKLLSRLHTSNPWRGEHCGRTDCWPCETKTWTEQDTRKECSKRSLVYETWCQTCYEMEKEVIEQEVDDEEERKKQIEGIRKHKYVGETARSAYERGWEHQEGLRKLEEDSHLLKHVAQYHQGVPMKDIKFGMKIRKYARSALERQVLESVLIQEERRSHLLMNSKSEYNRCSLPRLTTKIGNKEYDKERLKDQEEERKMDMLVRGEIGRRKKERCQMRRDEIHPPEVTENEKHKRRKVNEDGDYKRVLTMKKPEREYEMTEEKRDSKRRKVEEQPRKKILGPVLRGYELEDPIDWDEIRKKRQEDMDREEQERMARIRKARRLEESWNLLKLCRDYIKENSQVWRDRDDERELERAAMMRKERTQLAQYKKERFVRNHLRQEKTRKITELLGELPMGDQERWRKDQRQAEGRALKEMKDNMWKKWRGEPKGKENKIKIPDDDEKLDEKMRELTDRIEQYRKELREVEERKQKKKKLEDHWQMMRWLVKFIDQNRYAWERRRQIEDEEKEMNAVYEEWLAKDKFSQIEEMKVKKQQEMDSEKRKELRQERAKVRRNMWKNWRDKDEGTGTRTLPREGVRELPGQDNTLPNTGELPEKLGGDDPGGRGAYQELLMESTAPCNTGPHSHLEDLEPGESDVTEMMKKKEEVENDEIEAKEQEQSDGLEGIRMEIMLGMTQEEGIPCLLCLMHRCICHITLDLTKIETKLTMLRNKEVEKEVEEEEEDVPEGEVEGSPGGLLEDGGLTQIREGSSLHQEPAGNLEAKPEGEQKPPEARPPELVQRMREMMLKVEKQEEAEKAKKTLARKKREEARRKEEKKEASKTRSVKQMMEKWNKLGGASETGKTPTKLESDRNTPENKTGSSERRKQGTAVKTRKEAEARNASPKEQAEARTASPNNQKVAGKTKKPEINLVRKSQAAVGEAQEQGKVARKEEELDRKQASGVRKQDTREGGKEGKYNLNDELVRKPREEGSKEAAKQEARNKEHMVVNKEPCQGESGLSRRGRRSRISDLIQNFNELEKGREASQKVEGMNRNMVMKAVVKEEMSSHATKRKASEVEDEREVIMTNSAKKTRKLAIAARTPSISRDISILKYFKKEININYCSATNGSTGDFQGTVQHAVQGGDRVHPSQGVGELVQSGVINATPEAPTSFVSEAAAREI